MKKLFFPLLALLLVIAGCSEKFNVAAPYKNITVIYGFLRQSDTAHYVRVQKAFLDQDKSAFSMAKEPDSNFYNNIKVVMKVYRAVSTPIFLNSIVLERVNLDDEGYPKQPGTFFQSPNYAYKFTDHLDSTVFYRIVVTNLSTGQVDSSDAPVIGESKANFIADMLDNDGINNEGLNFYSILPTRVVQISCAYTTPVMPTVAPYSFNGSKNPTGVAQLFVRFNWVDSNISDGTKAGHYYDYDAGYLQGSGSYRFSIADDQLYNALRTGMGPAPANTVRLLDRADLIFYLSTNDFYNYYLISQTQGTGITGSEIQPVYTNVKGTDALGLYTAKAQKQGKITITKRTVDSLIVSPVLAPMNIIGTVYH